MALANSAFSEAKLASALQMHDTLLLHENHLLHERNAEESDSFYWDSLSAANKRRVLDRYADDDDRGGAGGEGGGVDHDGGLGGEDAVSDVAMVVLA
jgi:hypothetical protein